MSNRCILNAGIHHFDILRCLMDALLSTFTFCFVAAFEKYNVFKAELEIHLFTMQDDFGKNKRNLL
jgi:hypothetical protein